MGGFGGWLVVGWWFDDWIAGGGWMVLVGWLLVAD